MNLTSEATITVADMQTWPRDTIGLLRQNQTKLTQYHARRSEIDTACQENVELRMAPPTNEFLQIWKDTNCQVDQHISDAFLLGHHCTRLTEYEINNVKGGFLERNSQSLVNSRIDMACKNGLISANDAIALKAKNQAGESNRIDRLWFVFTDGTLKDEGDVERFFRNWGGESLYNYHEDDPVTGPLLQTIGTPAILQCKVPVREINAFGSVAERLVNYWLTSHGVNCDYDGEFDGLIETDLSGANILSISVLGSPEFERLTQHQNWRNPLK